MLQASHAFYRVGCGRWGFACGNPRLGDAPIEGSSPSPNPAWVLLRHLSITGQVYKAINLREISLEDPSLTPFQSDSGRKIQQLSFCERLTKNRRRLKLSSPVPYPESLRCQCDLLEQH
jgi:hypothetical protein